MIPRSANLSFEALEVMLIQIRENDNIKGINIGNFDIKLSAFADDTYFLTLDIQSLRHILDTCSVFGDYSSLTHNITLASAMDVRLELQKVD